MPPQERLVDLFDQRVEAKRFVIALAINRQQDLGERRARRGDSGRLKDGIRQRLADTRRVHHVVMQIELLHSVELLAIDVAIEVDLERPLASRRREQVTTVPFEPQADLVNGLAIEFDVGFHVFKFVPETAGPKRYAWTSECRPC